MRYIKRRKTTEDKSVAFQNEAAPKDRFSAIVRELAEEVKRDGLDAGRVDKAVELILHPSHPDRINWEWEDAITLRVRSQSNPNRWYSVDGQCGCPDSRFRGGPCKHQIARDLILQAEDIMARLPEAGRCQRRG